MKYIQLVSSNLLMLRYFIDYSKIGNSEMLCKHIIIYELGCYKFRIFYGLIYVKSNIIKFLVLKLCLKPIYRCKEDYQITRQLLVLSNVILLKRNLFDRPGVSYISTTCILIKYLAHLNTINTVIEPTSPYTNGSKSIKYQNGAKINASSPLS